MTRLTTYKEKKTRRKLLHIYWEVFYLCILSIVYKFNLSMRTNSCLKYKQGTPARMKAEGKAMIQLAKYMEIQNRLVELVEYLPNINL